MSVEVRPILQKIIGALSGLPIQTEYLKVGLKKSPTDLSADRNIIITHIAAKTWNIFVENVEKPLMIAFSLSANHSNDVIDISDPSHVGKYIQDDCVCSLQIYTM